MIKIFLLALLVSTGLQAQSIAEKKAGIAFGTGDLSREAQVHLTQLNRELADSHAKLREYHEQVMELYTKNAPEECYQPLLDQISKLRKHLKKIQNRWREIANECNKDEDYALWHQPETTIGQLVMDYGAQEYVYMMSPEISDLRLSIDSNLPVPRNAWNEMLDLILTQNGIGIKQLNPYLRQLYFIHADKSNLKLITNKRQDLCMLPPESRICFVLSPEPSDVRRIWAFLDKFVNFNNTVLQMIGRDILIIAKVGEIQDLLKLYDFVSTNRGDKEYRVISLWRVDAEEMSKILAAIFDHLPSGGAPSYDPEKGRRFDAPEMDGGNGLKVIPLANVAHALFLVGTPEEIRKAEEIIQEVEGQVGGPREKVIFWYTAKHSDPEELAKVLEKIYTLMVDEGVTTEPTDPPAANSTANAQTPATPAQPFPPANIYDDGYYLDSNHVVNGANKKLDLNTNPNAGRNNFIVDLKTGSIVMVVEADILCKMKDLIKKLDIPKKMVQIEVLLFEKRIEKDNSFGLNLLRLGDRASNTHGTSFLFRDSGGEDGQRKDNLGITEFFISRMRTASGIPAFDLAYKFLLNQDDVQINASPSILTINQTPAKIAIEEEISVNTGIFEVETNKGVTLKDAYARANYGITIEITPTIHLRDDDSLEDCDYVTLLSDITFETIHPQKNSRPTVTRRKINNEVRVADGQTVILGGLRKKSTTDARESIPFIGELPGIGKLFSNTQLHDHSTEMFIFITPKIVTDPSEQLERIRNEELCRRPGDIPCFLKCLVESREREKNRLMSGSMVMLFGREKDRYVCPQGEYDGR